MPQHPLAAFGRDYLAIPGPSVMPDAVLRAMHRSAPNIYHGALIEMVESIVPDLRRVARTKGHVAMYIGNGHATWEACLSNTVMAGEKVLVPATGRFGLGWADVATGLGIDAEVIDFGKSSAIDPVRVAERLAADKSNQIKAVLAVHVDTSTSFKNDVAALRAVLDDLDHPALLMADCMASLGCDPFEMDAWGVDVVIAGSQKGLMVPPGMCFVIFSDKAAEARARMDRVSRYWDWTPRANPSAFFEYWNGTAPTHHLYGLRAALDMIHDEGIENVWRRHHLLARAVWAAVEAWGKDGPMKMNVGDPAQRGHSVTAISIGAPHATALRDWTEQNLGLTLGIGLGMAETSDPAWHGYFRLGHMGHVSGHMVMGMLGGIDAGLKALDLPHGGGALEAASGVIAAG
ncbi:pyridoxal-phosphate-dependent aminotransferase family protein [Pseudosulfitobacter koreensis]|uniref:Aminotransferase class V-fold PLP-dependent enzyme n=1 Tax=Pseudosulfitobacter koreensis TaxID=2968472 RepID=A0ABT1Z4P9_9RHOB|nr:aminotransferase class V-fold PLP-dependent enzyme [Pseudosulfitobacter koreense]MCR8828112.1 aminotransferase class V-fold PLP-dependent enzyme [Pseudosulfitobacter koreense]